jgi:CheY-like chemotaxis protein
MYLSSSSSRTNTRCRASSRKRCEGGFETAILSSEEEALTLFRGKVADYKALVTDVNLKGSLSGWEVAKQIREMAAGFPVIYMTGASADQWTS